MTTYRDFTNLPAAPLGLDEGVNLVRDGYPDTKFVWDGTGRWTQVEETGGELAASTYLQQRTYKFSYSVAIDGGAEGTYVMRGDTPIPDNAIVTSVAADITENGATSASGTVAVTLQSAGDIQAAALATDLDVGSASVNWQIVYGVTDGTLAIASGGANGLKTTAERTPTVTIATGAITALTFDLYITCLAGAA